MIVRINQIDPAQFDGDSFASPGSPVWPPDGPTGKIHVQWTPRAFEVLILDTDEQNRPVDASFQQQQLRKVIPLAAAALAERGQVVVLRLDGPMSAGELLPALGYLQGAETRFACSEFQKLHAGVPATAASLRILGSPVLIGALCNDESIGLSRSVRLRAMAVPPDLVAPLLDVAATDDERWQDILPHTPFLLTTTPQLRSIRILSSKLEPAEIKTRLTRQLMEVSRTTPAAAPPRPARADEVTQFRESWNKP
ncbi:MAG TPA: hypothetical protein VHY37_09535 [Tepidisphaeraceae bacterium]|nr:hypothetical protein [Tepidisphaeraceae bacterium]